MNIIDWVLYIPLTLCVCYLLLYAIASKFYRAPQYPEARTLRHIAVLFPAYKEDRVILSSSAVFSSRTIRRSCSTLSSFPTRCNRKRTKPYARSPSGY